MNKKKSSGQRKIKKSAQPKIKDDVAFYITPDEVKKFKTDSVTKTSSEGKLAEPMDRLWACLLDYSPGIFGILFISIFKSHGTFAEIILRFISWLIGLINLVLVLRRGQTVGKFFKQIRIVDAKTGKTASWDALIFWRQLPFLILYVIFLLLVISNPPGYAIIPLALMVVDCLFIYRHDHRCLHDLIAGTKVVECISPDSIFEAMDKAG